MSATHGGKGSKQRPTDSKKFGDNYDAIFGKKDPVKKNMDKFHKPATHIDKKKEEKKNPPFRKDWHERP
tara:strand:- start:951 stop:1157 length:207 start_codon:yes stop_codon:yes gene_type:complete